MMINKRLINLCKQSKKYIILTVLCNIISIICNILIIFFVGDIINSFYLYKDLLKDASLKKGAFIYIVILLIVRFLCNIIQGEFSNKASAEVRVVLRNSIYKKLLKLGEGYKKNETSAGIVQISVDGVEQLEIYFGKYLPQFFYSIIAPVILFVFISRISIKAASVFIVCVPIIPLSIIAIMKIAKKILKEYWNSYADLGGTFLENLQGLTTLKVFCMDEERHIKMNEEAEGFRKITMKVLRMQLNSINIMDIVAFGGAALGIIAALVEFGNHEIMIGELIIIILLSAEFFIPLRLLGSYFHIAMNGMTACDRIFNILDCETDSNFNKRDKKVTNENISVRFENVDFSYDKERKILKNINFQVNKGEFVAVVGESGSGKSTLASLIMNFYNVENGKVIINDEEIVNINLEDLYNNISLVSTNSYIFNGTILDNLRMGKANASEDEVKEALKKAKLSEFVYSSKEGLNLCVGEGGNKLSGGQKQRLALARAILADREMIIFDEATSNIDVESEEDILDAIYELSLYKTVLMISHRLANVKKAHHIYVMKDGEIVQSGKHHELAEIDGQYKNMLHCQRELESIREAL